VNPADGCSGSAADWQGVPGTRAPIARTALRQGHLKESRYTKARHLERRLKRRISGKDWIQQQHRGSFATSDLTSARAVRTVALKTILSADGRPVSFQQSQKTREGASRRTPCTLAKTRSWACQTRGHQGESTARPLTRAPADQLLNSIQGQSRNRTSDQQP
jgi:hypothetical protein